MSPATKNFLAALIRHARGVLSECEKWVEAQPDDTGPRVPAERAVTRS